MNSDRWTSGAEGPAGTSKPAGDDRKTLLPQKDGECHRAGAVRPAPATRGKAAVITKDMRQDVRSPREDVPGRAFATDAGRWYPTSRKLLLPEATGMAKAPVS